jgi:hypothetical protein
MTIEEYLIRARQYDVPRAQRDRLPMDTRQAPRARNRQGPAFSGRAPGPAVVPPCGPHKAPGHLHGGKPQREAPVNAEEVDSNEATSWFPLHRGHVILAGASQPPSDLHTNAQPHPAVRLNSPVTNKRRHQSRPHPGKRGSSPW